MGTEIINEIIAVEKEIQARITEEGERIAQWQAGQEAEISLWLAQEMDAGQRQQAAAEETMQARVGEQVNSLLAAAEHEASRCQGLATEELERLVKRHLRQIMPGAGR